MVRYKNEQNKTKKVVNIIRKNNSKESSAKNNATKNNNSKGFYYSFLTIILILCLIQIAISAVLNVSKVISYKSKINQIQRTRDAALAMNEQLKDSINNFSNVAGLEAIARNNLKMSSRDEVLVIINSKEDIGEDNNNKNKKEQKAGRIKIIKP